MSAPGAEALVDRFRHEAAASGQLLPPGQGRTAARFEQLRAWAREDVALGRLLEAHADAAAIAAEAGVSLPAGTFGVWAAEGPGSRLEARQVGADLHLVGAKRYCTGAEIVDGALVTAHHEQGTLLVLLERGDFGRVDPAGWGAQAFDRTGTATVEVDAVLPRRAVLGSPGWYLERPGFWHGGAGVAACWAGAATGVLDRLAEHWSRRDPHSLAQLGSASATSWGMGALLAQAAAEIDAGPDDAVAAERRARAVRHLVDRLANELLDQVMQGAGPGPVAFDRDLERRVGEARLYTRQSHGLRDVEALGARLAAT